MKTSGPRSLFVGGSERTRNTRQSGATQISCPRSSAERRVRRLAVMERGSRIYVAGHTGLGGAALMRRLRAEGFTSLFSRGHGELDLRDRQKVFDYFREIRPEYVVLAAARVGGIAANIRGPVEFLVDNL